jgi:hypothetical protein
MYKKLIFSSIPSGKLGTLSSHRKIDRKKGKKEA